jgi:hypothetical protein
MKYRWLSLSSALRPERIIVGGKSRCERCGSGTPDNFEANRACRFADFSLYYRAVPPGRVVARVNSGRTGAYRLRENLFPLSRDAILT